MSITSVPNLGPDPFTVNAAVLNGKVDPLVTDYNGNIDNDNIAAGAAIANSKLNLASIAQNVTLAGTNVLSGPTTISGASTISGIVTMSSKILKLAKGADVASTAGTITLGDDGNYFDITGTAAITSITAKSAGTQVVLQFDSTASLVDGSNLKLAGNFQGAAESQIMLSSDGTNWFEVSRSPITALAAASQAEMETATATTVYVTPGRTQYHPGVAKAWCSFNGTGTPAMIVSHNMDASITDGGAGIWTVSFTTDFSSGSYCATFGVLGNGGDLFGVNIQAGSTPAAGSVILTAWNSVGGAVDLAMVNMAVYGDQA